MTPITWTAADGTQLFAVRRGPETPAGLPVVCLPGLTRNSRDFTALAEALADAGRTVLAVDYRGRGRSAHADPLTYRPDVEAADLLAGLDALGWSTVAVVGTSRGGIIAMILAAMAPDRLGPVVLNDIGPEIDTAGLAAITARMAHMIDHPPTDWDGAARDLATAMGPRFPALGPDDWTAFARQAYRDEGGRPVLDYDPRLLDAFASFDPAVGIPPFWPMFEALAPRPVLTIRGEHSDLLSPETVAAMADRMPAMAVHIVPGQGHAPLLADQPTIHRIIANI